MEQERPTPAAESTSEETRQIPRKPWTPPELKRLLLDQTENGGTTGSDGNGRPDTTTSP
jgi:hypothetical protein